MSMDHWKKAYIRRTGRIRRMHRLRDPRARGRAAGQGSGAGYYRMMLGDFEITALVRRRRCR